MSNQSIMSRCICLLHVHAVPCAKTLENALWSHWAESAKQSDHSDSTSGDSHVTTMVVTVNLTRKNGSIISLTPRDLENLCSAEVTEVRWLKGRPVGQAAIYIPVLLK